ncbi:RecA-superfamily ATPase possibly involved in signal transduction [Acidovorax sp. CF316]|uniref:ATPase domain-containing protein n=1 Tax=Acidovorax sp. CF316 TaxID=1144317 RepID=UPI00026BC308|nr:ATPase domain-containing protein [Acidovorax sp. CF316]EJE53114.1 RecA-superfamily ATPase possibly involved in signal transduction [Acidovorax sp. CF316]
MKYALHSSSPSSPPKGAASTGIAGLDDVLGGGLPPRHLYLVEGSPGTGKTTLALQFLIEGRDKGERGLYVTLSETSEELAQVAQSHGWSLDGIRIFDLVSDEGLSEEAEQTILHPSEFELGETTREVMRLVGELKPQRVAFDSLSELRLLAQSPLRYRRQILALKRFFAQVGCTVLMLDDKTSGEGDQQLHSIAHGVVHLNQNTNTYGPDKRQLRVVKLRGVKFRSGDHDFDLDRGGLVVFPRLSAGEHGGKFDETPISTGTSAFDDMLGGGLSPGSNLLLAGPAGVGKTTTAISCAVAAMRRGEKVAYYLFDEGFSSLRQRSRALGLDIDPFIANGQLLIRSFDPAEVSPGQFAHAVREAVEKEQVRLVVVDSLNSYMQAMPGGQYLLLQMHELLSYLNSMGVVTLIILSLHGTVGEMHADIDLSYLSDAMVQYRFFEARGEVLKALSVIKSRTAQHESTIRELRLGANGIQIGKPLTDFHGILLGAAQYTGRQALLGDADSASQRS